MSSGRSPNVTSTSGHDPEQPECDAPGPINPRTGQHTSYWILTADERAKGFVRPLRLSYKHVGLRPTHPTRPLTTEEQEQTRGENYVAFEPYPASASSAVGRYWTEAQLTSGCGAVTTMSREIAETYSRNPHFYGKTFCIRCGDHIRVGNTGEFVWVEADGTVTNERVGT